MSLIEPYIKVDLSSQEYDYEIYDYDEDELLRDYGWDPYKLSSKPNDYLKSEDWKNDEIEVPISQDQGTHTIQQVDYNNHGSRTLFVTCLLKYCTMIMKALKLDIMNVKWVYFKWVLIVPNVVIEICQATCTQENSLEKISTPCYLKSSVVTSSICVMISLVEAICEGKVVWQTKGYLGWFYCPGTERLFVRFALVFGVLSSKVQLRVNLVALVIDKSFLQFDMLPLLLSFGYMVAALVVRGGKDMVIKCDVHGKCVA